MSKIRQIKPSISEEVKQLEVSCTASWNVNHATTLEKSLEVSQNIKFIPTMWPSHFSPIYLTKISKSICSYKHLHKYVVPSNFIHTTQKLKTTQMSINRWMAKQIQCILCNKIVLRNIKSNKSWYIQQHGWISKESHMGSQSEVSQTKKKYLLYDYLHKMLQIQTRDRKQISDCGEELPRRTSGHSEYFHHLDCSDGFLNMHICQNISYYTL